jgi:hypothetical protein
MDEKFAIIKGLFQSYPDLETAVSSVDISHEKVTIVFSKWKSDEVQVRINTILDSFNDWEKITWTISPDTDHMIKGYTTEVGFPLQVFIFEAFE